MRLDSARRTNNPFNTMTPAEAHALAESKLHGPVIAPLLAHVKHRIKEAAEKGQFQIAHPLHGMGGGWVGHDQTEALWLALQKEGWVVKHHPDPDPCHPASGPYTTISW